VDNPDDAVPNQRVPVAPDAVIVRGFGNPDNERRAVIDNMRAHFDDPETGGECAISVASLPGKSAAELVDENENIVHKHYRWGKASDLAGLLGRLPEEDDPPHALVVLGSLIEAEDDPRLDDVFAALPNVVVNPHYQARKRRRK
jgi:hypothetical protein